MNLAPLHEAYGRYVIARDRLDAVVGAALIQETQLRVFHGVLLVAHLSTKSALGALKGILVQAGGDRAKAAMTSVKAIHQLLKMHPLGQSKCRVAADGRLVFTRTEVGPKLAGAVMSYTAAEVHEAAEALEQQVAALAETLGIDDAALDRMQRSVEEALTRRGDGADAGEPADDEA